MRGLVRPRDAQYRFGPVNGSQIAEGDLFFDGRPHYKRHTEARLDVVREGHKRSG
jgi:hypothetical protein